MEEKIKLIKIDRNDSLFKPKYYYVYEFELGFKLEEHPIQFFPHDSIDLYIDLLSQKFKGDLEKQFKESKKTEISKQNVDVDSLKKVATYLEGIKQGRGGNLLPLGNNDLEQLWNAIAFLQGDERFECNTF